jgi:hypothetical protein
MRVRYTLPEFLNVRGVSAGPSAPKRGFLSHEELAPEPTPTEASAATPEPTSPPAAAATKPIAAAAAEQPTATKPIRATAVASIATAKTLTETAREVAGAIIPGAARLRFLIGP